MRQALACESDRTRSNTGSSTGSSTVDPVTRRSRRNARASESPTGRPPVPHDCFRFIYNWGVQAHWRETTVGEHGDLILKGLPFEPGQPVEVLVVSKTAGSTTLGGQSLRESVLEFREPLEPVASEDWDALQ